MRDDLIIVGTGAIADVIADYFEHDPRYNIVAFAIDSKHIDKPEFKGKPIVPFESVDKIYPSTNYLMFIAVGYVQLNHLRARFYNEAKAMGYMLVNYSSPHAYIHHNVLMGDNCFIFENNVIQYDVKIGNNVMLWSGNHIGHSTILRNHVYVASHVVVSGYCDIGEYSFIGVNAAVADKIKVGRNCLIGMGANITKDTEDDQVYVPQKSVNFDINKLRGNTRVMFHPEGDTDG